MNMLKFGYGIVLDGFPDIPEFHFFWGLDTPRPDLVQMLYSDIFQKSLNVSKDICLEAKHLGAHHIDQLKKKCVICRQRKINHSGCL